MPIVAKSSSGRVIGSLPGGLVACEWTAATASSKYSPLRISGRSRAFAMRNDFGVEPGSSHSDAT